MSSSSMWLLDLDEEVSALRRASRRRVRVDAAEQLSVFAAESHRRLSLSRGDARWDASGAAWDADAWLLGDLPAASSTHSLFTRRNSGVRRLLEEVEAPSAANDDVFRQLRERNRKLEAAVSDVTEVNKRWQKHHSEREVYLQKLQTTIEELQRHNVAKETTSKADAGAGGGVTPERLAQSEAGNARLRLELDAAHRKLQALEKEHQEHVHLLNIQVRSYRDDWEAERREKEQALRDKAAFEDRCRRLEEQLAEKAKPIEKSVMEIAPCGCPCEPVALTVQQCPRNKSHHTSNNTFRTSVHLPCGVTNNKVLKRRDTLDSSIDSSRASSPALSASAESGIVTIGFEDGLASLTSFSYPDTSRSVSSKSIEIGGCGTQQSEEPTRVWLPPSQPGGAAEEGVLTQTRDTVVCPRCERVFAPDRHLDFLDHFEQCPADATTTSVAHFTLNDLN